MSIDVAYGKKTGRLGDGGYKHRETNYHSRDIGADWEVQFRQRFDRMRQMRGLILHRLGPFRFHRSIQERTAFYGGEFL